MTQPEPIQPNDLPVDTAALPDVLDRVHEVIEVDELDKDNRTWTLTYVSGLRERLTNEQAAAAPDFVMISYLKREIATYQELLDRTDKK
jgi:hypothetical protein